MKITENQSASTKPLTGRSTNLDVEPSQNFSKLLSKKKTESTKTELMSRTDLSRKGKKLAGEDKFLRKSPASSDKLDAAVFSLSPLQASDPIQQADTPQGTTEISKIEQLVQELWLGVNSKGQQEVQIQLNSTSFAGLRIQISKGATGVSIKFFSRSAEVVQTLTQNLSALSQALIARGIHAVQFQVHSDTGPIRRDARSRTKGDRQGGKQGRY